MKKTVLKKVQAVSIELAVTDDFEKTYKQAEKGFVKHINEYKELRAKARKLLQDINGIGNDFEAVGNAYYKIEKLTNDLGVDVPGDVRRSYENADRFARELSKAQQDIKAFT